MRLLGAPGSRVWSGAGIDIWGGDGCPLPRLQREARWIEVCGSLQQKGTGFSLPGELGEQFRLSPVYDGHRGFLMEAKNPVSTFICLGCHDKGPQAGWLKQQKCICLQFWSLGRLRSRCWQLWFCLQRGLSPWPADGCFLPVLTWSSPCVCLCPHFLFLKGH